MRPIDYYFLDVHGPVLGALQPAQLGGAVLKAWVRKNAWTPRAWRAVKETAIGMDKSSKLQDARYVIKTVICDPNFERLVLGCIEADFCK